MKETFITEWKISDYDGRRDNNIMSIGTINGEHVYACERLTTWFRLGKYIIKHDFANYLLGVTPYIPNERLRTNVRYRHWDAATRTWWDMYCVDDIVSIVNKKFGKDFDYIGELLMLQRELVGYEWCFDVSRCYGWNFDYKEFLKGKDKYRRKLRRKYLITRFEWWLHYVIRKIGGKL